MLLKLCLNFSADTRRRCGSCRIQNRVRSHVSFDIGVKNRSVLNGIVATEKFFGINAFKFVKEGKATTLRYRIVPVAGEAHFDTEALQTKSATYLFDEFPERLQAGPIAFKLLAQIAKEGDITDDATEIWPEEREVVELGTLEIEKTLGDEESRAQQKRIIFDPIPRVEGVEASNDPLLKVRANVYLASGEQRRSA